MTKPTISPSGKYGRFRIRRKIGDKFYSSYHASREEAEAAAAALPVAPRKAPFGLAEHKKQVESLPPFTSLRNIRRSASGYAITITRGTTMLYGGHFSGPKALLEAVAKRDALEAKYPTTR